MRRSIVLFVLLLGLLLAACAPAGTPAPATSQPQPTADNMQPTTAPQATEPAINTPEPAAPVATPDMEKVLNPQPDDHKLRTGRSARDHHRVERFPVPVLFRGNATAQAPGRSLSPRCANCLSPFPAAFAR